jgi:hypothetical protein
VSESSGLGSGPRASGLPRAPAETAANPDEVWLLQAEAAELAGCSVSAIRKWRREGSVAFRRTTTPGGLDRVEVRLGDVLTRAGTRPVVAVAAAGGVPAPGQEQPPPPQGPAAGTVLVSLADLQTLFGRMAAPERRPDELQAHFRTLESEVSFMRGQMARLVAAVEERAGERRRTEELERRLARTEAETERLRRRLAAVVRELEKARWARTGGPERPGDSHEPDTGHGMGPVARTPATRVSAPSEVPPRDPAGPTERRPTFEGWLEGRPAPEKPAAPAGPPSERLADELGHLYRTLAARPRTPAGSEERARWAAELRRYDTVLVKACSRLGIATEHRPGDRLSASDRVALTRALADAGLDVRRSPANVEG